MLPRLRRRSIITRRISTSMDILTAVVPAGIVSGVSWAAFFLHEGNTHGSGNIPLRLYWARVATGLP